MYAKVSDGNPRGTHFTSKIKEHIFQTHFVFYNNAIYQVQNESTRLSAHTYTQ